MKYEIELWIKCGSKKMLARTCLVAAIRAFLTSSPPRRIMNVSCADVPLVSCWRSN